MNIKDEAVLYDETPETFVLSAILNTDDDNEIITAFNYLKEEHFHSTKNRAIFKCMQAIYENDKIPIHRLVILSKADELGLSDVIKRDYLNSLSDDFKSFQNIEQHINKLIEIACRRMLRICVLKAMESVCDLTQPLTETAQWVEQKTNEIKANLSRKSTLPISETMDETISDIKNAYNSVDGIVGITTGFTSLNQRIGGFEKGQLIVLAGRPGMGKTTLAINMAFNLAMWHNKKILIFTYEVSRKNIYRKLISIASDISTFALRTGKYLNEEKLSVIETNAKAISLLPIYVDDSGKDTVSSIKAKAMKLIRELGGLDLVIIDHIQLMRSDRKRETRNRNEELGEVSGELKKLATHLNLPVLVLSQFNRDAVKGKGNKEVPKISELRDSGAIEQDADIVLIIHNPKSDEKTGVCELHIGKNRDGMDGFVKLNITPHFTRFEELVYNNNIEQGGYNG